MEGITEKETKMLSLLKEISKNSSDDCDRIYLEKDPVTIVCNEYYKEMYDFRCISVHQVGKQFIPSVTKTIKLQEEPHLVNLEFVQPKFIQEEFNF